MGVLYNCRMKLRILFVYLIFLPQITLAQTPGSVTEKVATKKYPDQSYALYLPKSYSTSNSYGLIFLLDPGAEGKFPVSLYKDLADKYSLILVGSNNSKNGPVDVSLRASSIALEDVLQRFNIDKKFIVTSGFSGGARTAVDVAVANKLVTGSIGCGAAFNSPDVIKIQSPLPFAEVIGQLDMNYQEALRAQEYLQSIHSPASLTFFYGGHDWPPVSAYEDAVAWHYLRAYDRPDHKKEIISNKLKLAQVKIDSGYMAEASQVLKPLLGNKSVDSMFSIVQKDKRTRPQAKAASKLDAMEFQMQQQFFYAYQKHMAYAAPDSAFHPKYWEGFRRDCDELLAGDRAKKLAGIRLIDFGWRRCSENYYHFIEDKLYRQAAMSAKIWTLVTPKNAYPCLLAARAFALQKRKPETFEYLRMAVARGFKDMKRISADPAFAEYADSDEFKKIFN